MVSASVMASPQQATPVDDHVKNGTSTKTSPSWLSAAGPAGEARVIDGKQLAAEIRGEVRAAIAAWRQERNASPPTLVAILVGDDPASCTYVGNKMKACEEVGIVARTDRLPATISEPALLAHIAALNASADVDAILVQVPLPAHVDERRVCNAVALAKDVDGFHERSLGRLALGAGDAFVPATALGVVELLTRLRALAPTFGRDVVVVGRSKNVGLPIALLAHSDGRHARPGLDATVTICHRYTPPARLKEACLRADVVVAAAGVPGLITRDMVKAGACLVDVGITQVTTEAGERRLVGDVDFDGCKKVAGFITPVPGGVGPLTVAMLMRNTLDAAMNLRG